MGACSVIEDCQRPGPAGQLTGDRGVGDHRAFLALIEAGPPGVQPMVGGMPPLTCGHGGGIPAAPQVASWPISAAVMPGRFDQQVTGIRSAALGDPAVVSRAVARLVNAWIEPDIGG